MALATNIISTIAPLAGGAIGAYVGGPAGAVNGAAIGSSVGGVISAASAAGKKANIQGASGAEKAAATAQRNLADTLMQGGGLRESQYEREKEFIVEDSQRNISNIIGLARDYKLSPLALDKIVSDESRRIEQTVTKRLEGLTQADIESAANNLKYGAQVNIGAGEMASNIANIERTAEELRRQDKEKRIGYLTSAMGNLISTGAQAYMMYDQNKTAQKTGSLFSDKDVSFTVNPDKSITYKDAATKASFENNDINIYEDNKQNDTIGMTSTESFNWSKDLDSYSQNYINVYGKDMFDKEFKISNGRYDYEKLAEERKIWGELTNSLNTSSSKPDDWF